MQLRVYFGTQHLHLIHFIIDDLFVRDQPAASRPSTRDCPIDSADSPRLCMPIPFERYRHCGISFGFSSRRHRISCSATVPCTHSRSATNRRKRNDKYGHLTREKVIENIHRRANRAQLRNRARSEHLQDIQHAMYGTQMALSSLSFQYIPSQGTTGVGLPPFVA